jgi:RNA polymerase primary sigma factor
MNRVDLIRQINHFISHSQQEHASIPSEEEIAEALGISLEEVSETLALARRIRSLDAALGEDEENSLLEILPDETQESPDLLLSRDSLRAAVDLALDTLDEREREVIRLYFGLDGDSEMTLGAIGARFGLTRERVRQIKEKALRKLRSPARARRLMAYAEEM